MFTSKDLEMRTIFVINCIEHNRSLRVSNGELMLEEIDGDRKKTLTKIPFQKMLALFVVGHITVTTPLIEKCKLHGVALVVMKPNLRPVFFWANAAEANFLLWNASSGCSALIYMSVFTTACGSTANHWFAI